MDVLLLQNIVEAKYSITGIHNTLLNKIQPIVIECFDSDTLIAIRKQSDLPLVQLMDLVGNQTMGEVVTEKNLNLILTYAVSWGYVYLCTYICV